MEDNDIIYDQPNKKSKIAIYQDNEGKYHVRNFQDLPVTTIVSVALLDGQMFSDIGLFYTLPSTKDTILEKGKNYDIGTILSVRYDGHIKGIHGKFFPNSIMVDIWTSVGKIHTKPTDGNIHICGTKNDQNAKEASELIIAHIKKCGQFIKDIDSNKKLFRESCLWLAKNSVGKNISVNINTYQSVLDDTEIIVTESEMKQSIKWPDENDIPKQYQHYIKEFIYRSSDLLYVDQIMTRVRNLLSINYLISPSYGLNRMTRSMANYNYELGFKINRRKLVQALKEEADYGCYVEFDNVSKTYVSIKFPSEPSPYITRKGKEWFETFSIQHSGCIKQSGTLPEIMEQCYLQLMIDIIKLGDIIKK